ncbi:aldo/keto reductase [Corynebacterium comes]|uniref:2,5-diketo-D-gluconic acid reductase A n=1 Tax=Corynebacterium comes TaxID=2675218 RepID=A0A6B8W331_9CORY|nr:aldo/keto reductase [Corynebacterium comes]QGU05336.1 2,5-diketo-D-gluconic acid reductase A [Corynebacterium comes]
MTPKVPAITLNDNTSIPQLGFGVFQIPPADTERLVSVALEAGYRHIDTAAIYGNEAGVGRAIAASGIPREELYVTTKLWNDRHDDAGAALDESLERLGLDRVDLYLIHWPCPAQNRYVEAWQQLVGLREKGLTTSIGVSNFLPEHIDRLSMTSRVTPVVNQIELHPALQQWKDIDAARVHGIRVEAWAPLGQGRTDLLEAPEIVDAATAHGVSPAQVIIRWHLQNGVILFPKSSHPERIRENIDVFGFELSSGEMADITSLDEGEDGRVGPHPSDVES